MHNRCIAEKNMAESLELHVVRAFFAKAEKKSPFSDVSLLKNSGIDCYVINQSDA